MAGRGLAGLGSDRMDHKTAAAIRRMLALLERPTFPLVKPIKRADTSWIERATRRIWRTPRLRDGWCDLDSVVVCRGSYRSGQIPSS
jgi:hypothetical protein